ncbi:MAG: thioredoxin domain-containing protein, partial [Thermodesulfobacteriota bacterium]
EHESFEDPDVARLMNETFVSIKVDREERPDIDNIYMTVCQMISKSGCGWPLNVIMTPDNKPFYVATYIPKETRFGRVGMIELIPQVKELWNTKRGDVIRSADQITNVLKEGVQFSSNLKGEELDETSLKEAFTELEGSFDSKNGGFGTAPKFPTPHNFLFLLRYWKRSGDVRALNIVEKSLQSMRMGGIYDHVGFGFHRYSTDQNWLVPHFEKMLYDQAMLAMAYVEVYQATGKKEYAKTADEIFTYVLRDMTDSSGGFYSAEDADSEGEEGKFYFWTKDEIQEVLGEGQSQLILKVFNVIDGGNFSGEATGRNAGSNILNITNSLSEIASSQNISEEELELRIDEARTKLFEVREKRIHPHKDDKILTNWNGLTIAALAKGAQVLNESKYIDAAKKSANFILENMRDKNGRLLHRYRDGDAGIKANADDYAFFIWGLIELYEASFDVRYLQTALELKKEMINHFWDNKNGGFYFTSDDGDDLIVRQKEINDGAIPSGNSVAMLNMLRLGRITADTDLEEKASMINGVFSKLIGRYPSAFTQFLVGLDFGIGPSYEVIIAGNSGAEDTGAMIKALRMRFVPNKIVLFRPTDKDATKIATIAEYTTNHLSIGGKATAYVCLNYECKLPTTEIDKMLELLNVKRL